VLAWPQGVAVGRNWWDVDVGRADDSGTSVGTSSAWLVHVLSPRASAGRHQGAARRPPTGRYRTLVITLGTRDWGFASSHQQGFARHKTLRPLERFEYSSFCQDPHIQNCLLIIFGFQHLMKNT